MSSTDRAAGLTSRQVEERKANGLVNTVRETGRKTAWQIIASNLFTLFNLVNTLIFVLILTTGKYINTLFMGVVLSNTLIGMIEEIKARRIIEKLRIITAQSAVVRRDSEERQIVPEEIVIDDVYILRPGSQVCADGMVLVSEELEVDESLLTGESEPVRKNIGDRVLSGSFVTAGRGEVLAVNIGGQNYAQSMTLEAQRYKRARSEILVNINKIIKVVSALILPVGILLFSSQYFRSGMDWDIAVVSSAAGIIGMIPEGLVLLSSITLTVGVIKLARRRTIVQELAGLEVLARINVLCLDKTGTLTRGILQVTDILPLAQDDPAVLQQSAAALVKAFPERNSTSQALAERFTDAPDWTVISKVPFSSIRMWSGATFSESGTWLMGAPENILQKNDDSLISRASALAKNGHRVILLASSDEALACAELPGEITPRAFLLLADTLREEARPALDFFAKNDVEIKIITGDSPLTASAIAVQLGLKGAGCWVDMGKIHDQDEIDRAARQYTIFGRTSPKQKKLLISAMQNNGQIVAMAGDGTNDVLAMHQADCSIVMASGSPAAKAMANIALLDSDFTVLPEVVREGRQVINNVERVASLYLVKTTYSVILTVFFILIGMSYFFFPIHQTLLGMAAIGIPSFFLALEKNTRRVQPGFLGKVIRTAIPGGVTIAINLMILQCLMMILSIEIGQVRLIAVIITGIAGLLVLLRVSLPLNRLRGIILLAMTAFFFTAVLFFPGRIELPGLQMHSLYLITGFAAATYPLILLINKLLDMIKIRMK